MTGLNLLEFFILYQKIPWLHIFLPNWSEIISYLISRYFKPQGAAATVTAHLSSCCWTFIGGHKHRACECTRTHWGVKLCSCLATQWLVWWWAENSFGPPAEKPWTETLKSILMSNPQQTKGILYTFILTTPQSRQRPRLRGLFIIVKFLWKADAVSIYHPQDMFKTITRTTNPHYILMNEPYVFDKKNQQHFKAVSTQTAICAER